VTASPGPSGAPALVVRRRVPVPRAAGVGPDPSDCVRLAGAGADFSRGFHVVLAPRLAAALRREARGSLAEGRERAGWLIGHVFGGGAGVVLADYAAGPRDRGSRARYQFDPDAVAVLLEGVARGADAIRSARGPAGRVGWFHTHPRMEVFLSDLDREVHLTAFTAVTDVAMVWAPQDDAGEDRLGAFRRGTDGELAPVDGWWLGMEAAGDDPGQVADLRAWIGARRGP